MTKSPTEFNQLTALRAEFEASNELLSELWDVLAARGADLIPVGDRELAHIEQQCRVERAASPNNRPVVGLRC